jgi:multimeric flavodoxin WrbA
MKILTIVGSPRINANTHFLAKKFAEGAKMAGAEVEELVLSQLKIHPCIACYQCEEDGVCQFEDDFPTVVEKIRASDGILLTTPVYCCSVPAQMKAFMDRFYALTFPTWVTGLEGKYAAFIITAATPLPEKKRPSFEFRHHPTFKTMLRLGQDLKIAGDIITTIREKIDPMKPFDSTIDTLRIMYQFCTIVRMGVLGAMEVTGLGHNPKAVQDRGQEVQKAVEFGSRFTRMVRMLNDDAPFALD